MTDVSLDLTTATFTKTAVGQHEIQTRSLGLPPLTRRVLVLVDGHRSGKELAAFIVGQDIDPILKQLIASGCIDAKASASVDTKTSPAAATGPKGDLALLALPLAGTRSPKDFEMARHFMTNTVNAMFGDNQRLSTKEAIYNCQTTEDLRRVYPLWLEAMSASGTGSKRLPELRKELFHVL